MMPGPIFQEDAKMQFFIIGFLVKGSSPKPRKALSVAGNDHVHAIERSRRGKLQQENIGCSIL